MLRVGARLIFEQVIPIQIYKRLFVRREVTEVLPAGVVRLACICGKQGLPDEMSNRTPCRIGYDFCNEYKDHPFPINCTLHDSCDIARRH